MQMMVSFDKDKLLKFKQAYSAAVESGFEEFSFEAGEYLVSYAKYLIEFLEARLGLEESH